MTDPLPPDPDEPEDADDADDADDAPVIYGLVGLLHRYRRIVGTVGLAWFGVVMLGGIMLSQIEAREGLHVFGPRRWVAGRSSAVRVGLRDLRWGTFRTLSQLEISFHTGNPSQDTHQTVPVRLDEQAGDLLQGTVVAPATPGDWRLVLRGEGPSGVVHAVVPVEVSPEPAPVGFPPPDKPRTPPQPDQGPLKLEVVPLDGVMSGGLPGELAIRALDAAGHPVGTHIALTMPQGRMAEPLPAQVITDARGLAILPVVPQTKDLELRLAAADGSRAARKLFDTPTQFTLRPTAPVARPGESLTFEVRSLHQEGPALFDIWHGAHWVATQAIELAGGAGALTASVPALGEDPAIVWTQIYKSAYLPGEARGGRYLLCTTRAPAEALGWLLRELEGANIDAAYARALSRASIPDAEAAPIIRFMLGRIPRPDHDPPLLADSGISAKQTVSALKSRWQNRIILALMASGALLFVVMGALLIFNYRDVTRRWAESGGNEDGVQGTRKRFFVNATYMFAIIAVFILAVVQLMLSMHW